MRTGPLRQIVDWFLDDRTGAQLERLECGHVVHRRQDAYGHTTASRRRCWKCAREEAEELAEEDERRERAREDYENYLVDLARDRWIDDTPEEEHDD